MRRFGSLPRGNADVMLHTDNALVYASELYRELANFYGPHREFIRPHTPEQNGLAESFVGTLKLERIGQHRFDTTTRRRRPSPRGSSIITNPGRIRGSTISRR